MIWHVHGLFFTKVQFPLWLVFNASNFMYCITFRSKHVDAQTETVLDMGLPLGPEDWDEVKKFAKKVFQSKVALILLLKTLDE